MSTTLLPTSPLKQQYQPVESPSKKARLETENLAQFCSSAQVGDENKENAPDNMLKETWKTVKQTVRFAKLSEYATKPSYGSKFAAGCDLYSAHDMIVPSRGKLCVPTDIQVEIPYGYYGRVAPRSGLAAKHFIDVGAGVIDSDYRGNVQVLLFNFSEQDFKVNRGDRIAQLIFERICHAELIEAESLEDSVRGGGGFGSTGI